MRVLAGAGWSTWHCMPREVSRRVIRGALYDGLVDVGIFCVLYPEMHIHDRRGHTFKSWLLLIPISAATLVSLSRTMDYRHHATDVIAGGIVGTLIAWYCYRQYYPVSLEACRRLVCPSCSL